MTNESLSTLAFIAGVTGARVDKERFRMLVIAMILILGASLVVTLMPR